MNNNIDLQKAIVTGLEVLNDPDNKVASNTIEDLAVFKNILRAVLNGELVLASPDRILPEGAVTPNEEPTNPEGNNSD